MDFLLISVFDVAKLGHPAADSDAAHLAGRRLRAAHGLRAPGAAGRGGLEVVVKPSLLGGLEHVYFPIFFRKIISSFT